MRKRSVSGRRQGNALRVEDAVSCGGVVYRFSSQGIEVVLCGRRVNSVWALPKGTPLPGETLEQTAMREVEEETGLRTRIEARVGEIEYWFSRVEQGVRFHKLVHHYLMAPTGGDLRLHDQEYDFVRWFTIAEAKAVMTYANEATILNKAAGLIDHDVRNLLSNGSDHSPR